ncbi:hypothetical protein M413DRAFT_415587 [Hebeloma cylindrosporum]|uniref:RBR-type E3 ubiquitin transferase n=1 Tax=Hebeloma cylindrosporum TaxID=76867 RepID=A0A0C3C7S0_HEBCY|nr:hypothetical protein M413DRAFT_415587 [Hebeloma cylindrosporum h7]
MSALPQPGGPTQNHQRRIPDNEKPCFQWLQGNCRFGDGCKFRHEPGDKGRANNVRTEKQDNCNPKGPRPIPNSNIPPVPVPVRTKSAGNKDAESTSNGNERKAAPKNKGNKPNSTSETQACKHWKQGKCPWGNRCRYKHDILQLPNARVQVANAHFRVQSSQSNRGPLPEKTTQPAGREERNLILLQSDENQIEDALKRLDEAREAREAAQRELLGLVEEEGRYKEEVLVMEIAAGEAMEPEAAFRQEEIRRRVEANAKAKEAKARTTKEAKEARIQEKALKREAKKKETETRIAREKAEREEREAAERRRQLEIAAQREKEATVVEQYVVSGTSLVTCSAGFNIQHVIPGFDLCRIVIHNLPRNARREEIADIFIQRGIDNSEFSIVHVKEIGNKQEVIVLANVEGWEAISAGLHGITFRDEVLSFSVSDNASGSVPGTAGQSVPSMTISWRIPSETIIANYHSMEEARNKVRELDKKIWNGRRINARMNDPPRQDDFLRLQHYVPESVKLFNCPPGSEFDEDFYQFVGSHSIRALNSSATFELQDSFDRIHRHISGERGVRIDTYQVLKRGNEVDGEAKVKVEFDDWEDAKRAHALIDKQRIGRASPFYQCWVPKQLQYKIVIPRQQYESQKKQWDALGEKKGPNDPYVQTRKGDRGDVFIEIVGKEKKASGPLKVRVESMVAGDKLDSTFWHPSFASPRSRAFFDRIYAEKQVFIWSDFKTRSLKAYGESRAVEEARPIIKGEVERLSQSETTRVLAREWVAFFVREGYGKLAELLGEENVRLDVEPRMCRITIKGGEEANHSLQRLIDQARTAVSVDAVLPSGGEAETCPVCYGDVSHPEQLGCGHSYCSGCLKHFLTSAVDNKTFPLVCVGNEATCNVPVTIPFVRRFLPAQTFQRLIEAAFDKYLEQHQQQLKYCTTPDCKQIYRRRADKMSAKCPACFLTICLACDEEAHTGVSCEEQRILRNPAEQERLNEELAASSGYKRCPTCRAMIEKTEGCNHMTCRCGAHICWKCMNVFQTGRETSDHLIAAHGGIFDVSAAVVVADEWNDVFIAGQAEEMARIARERLVRERALRHVAANPFAGQNQDAGNRDPVMRGPRIRRVPTNAEEQATRARIDRQILAEEEARQLREAARRREENRGGCVVM